MKNTITIFLTALVLVALPACYGSKKKDQATTKRDEITLNNAVDTISIEHVEQVTETEANSKF